MHLVSPAQTVLDILHPWFSRKSDTLHAFSRSAASYEEWLNWELFDAFLHHGYQCEGRPDYRNWGTHSMGALKGDLLAVCPDTQAAYLIEMALVGSGTQNKWRQKIQRDHEKLQQLRLHQPETALHRIQLVLLAAADETDVVQTWGDWLHAIPFYATQRAMAAKPIALRHPGIATQGEAVLLLWEVAADH